MTAKELIEKLQQFPPNAPICVYDQEGYWCCVKQIEAVPKHEIYPSAEVDGYGLIWW